MNTLDLTQNPDSESACLNVLQYLLENYQNFDFKEKPINGILQSTVNREHLSVIKYLVEHRFLDISLKSFGGQTALHSAAQAGELAVAKFLLERGVDIEARDENDMTPLLLAAHKSQLEVVKLLVTHGADVNAKHKSGETVLHFATKNGQFEIFKYFIEDSNFKLKELDHELLLLSAQSKSPDFLKYLVEEKGLNANFKNQTGHTPLNKALKAEHFETIKYLVEEQCVNISTDNDFLNQAIESKNLEIIQYLLDNGANVNLTHYGLPPILHAASKANLKVFLYLLERGADINCLKYYRYGVLHYAAETANLDIIKFLVDEKKYDLNIKLRSNDASPFMQAVSCGTSEAVKYFIEEKNFSLPSDVATKKIFLHKACLNENVDAVTYLVEVQGLDIKARDDKGYLPHFYAAENNNLSVLKYFLNEKKLSLHLKDNKSRSILHLAAAKGHINVVKYLIEEHNANFDIKDINGKTPLSLAAEFSDEKCELLKYLSLKGCDLSGTIEKSEYNITFVREMKYELNILHIAAEIGDVDLIKILIEKRGMQAHEKDSKGQTPLFYAAYTSKFAATKYFWEFTECDKKGTLDNLINSHNLDAFKLLVRQGAKAVLTDDERKSLISKAKMIGADFCQYITAYVEIM